MPHVNKEERYVDVAYVLKCGFKRAEALANDLYKQMEDEEAIFSVKEDTREWDDERTAIVIVTYLTLKDANRLDAEVRRLLSRKANYTYDPNYGEGYGSRGPYLTVNPITSLTPINST